MKAAFRELFSREKMGKKTTSGITENKTISERLRIRKSQRGQEGQKPTSHIDENKTKSESLRIRKSQLSEDEKAKPKLQIGRISITESQLSRVDLGEVTRVESVLPSVPSDDDSDNVVLDFQAIVQKYCDSIRSFHSTQTLLRQKLQNEVEEKHAEEVESIQAAKRAKEAELEEAAKRLEALQTKYAQLERDNEQLRQDNKQLKQENQDYAELIEDYEKTIKESDQKYEALKQRLQSREKERETENDDLLKEIKNQQKKHQQLMRENLELKKQLKTAKEAQVSAETEGKPVGKAKLNPKLGMHDENEGEQLINETAGDGSEPGSPVRLEGEPSEDAKKEQEALTINERNAAKRRRENAGRAVLMSNAAKKANGTVDKSESGAEASQRVTRSQSGKRKLSTD